MARPTRQQRRARRERSESSLAEQARASRTSSTLRTQKPGSEPKVERPRRFHFIHFLRESVGELKKVEWPGRQQLVQGTVVVIIACAIVGGYLAICDVAFKRLVQNVLLG